MIKFLKHIAILLLVVCIMPSCKKDDKETKALSESVRISAFSLQADKEVLDNLENVFFTIDLENGLIYNADSLPKGTDVSKLKVKITTDKASKVNIADIDSTFDYIKNNNVPINLNFPRNIEVISQSGMHKKNYQLKVNVHKLNPDQLYWGGVQYARLPGEGKLSAQKTVKFQELIYCFMTRDDNHMLATAPHPAEQWLITELALSFTPNWLSLHTSVDAFYILDTDQNLYTSTDGINWDNTGKSYANIVGCIGSELLTLSYDGTNYYHDKYPQPEGYSPIPVSPQFPITGFSDMLTYNSPWLTSPQGMIVGGRTANGQLTGAMWGYDGNSWAMLNDQLPVREGATFFSFVTFFTDDYWVTSELPTWFILGGFNDNSTLRDIWVSNNYGINWQKAEETLMLPGYIISRGNASVVVCDEPRNTTYATWQSVDMLPLPQDYRLVRTYSSTSTQLVPYIYMFGGMSSDDYTFDQVWRGTINRLRFDPIP